MIDILPNLQKTADSQPDFRVLTQGIEIGAGWTRKGETSGKDYVSLSIAAPEFGSKKLYANLGRLQAPKMKTFTRSSGTPATDTLTPNRRSSSQYIRKGELNSDG